MPCILNTLQKFNVSNNTLQWCCGGNILVETMKYEDTRYFRKTNLERQKKQCKHQTRSPPEYINVQHFNTLIGTGKHQNLNTSSTVHINKPLHLKPMNRSLRLEREFMRSIFGASDIWTDERWERDKSKSHLLHENIYRSHVERRYPNLRSINIASDVIHVHILCVLDFLRQPFNKKQRAFKDPNFSNLVPGS